MILANLPYSASVICVGMTVLSFYACQIVAVSLEVDGYMEITMCCSLSGDAEYLELSEDEVSEVVG